MAERRKKVRKSKKDKPIQENNLNLTPETNIQTIIEQNKTDRMMRYARNPVCPECGELAYLKIRRGDYKLMQCRNRKCEHRWESNE